MLIRLLCLGAVAATAGCATITRESNDVLVVNSTPRAAQVKMSDGQTCTGTPCSFKVLRKSELNVLVTKEGCKPQQVRVTNRVASGGGAAMAGNIIAGGVIGAAVDAGSGAMLELVPNPLNVALECRR